MKDREAVTTNGRAVFYAAMWDDFRQAAMDTGWALALHGSLASDMDIMAMPWTKDSAHYLDMIEAVKDCFDKPDEIKVSVTHKPNNRLVFTLSIWADFYLDISVVKSQADVKEPLTDELDEAEIILHKHIDKQSLDELSGNIWKDMLEAMEEYAVLVSKPYTISGEMVAELLTKERARARDLLTKEGGQL